MIEIKVVSYEEQRTEHFRELMKKMQRKIDWWQAAGRSLNRSYNSRWHNECSEAGVQYSFYKDALEALENQPQWISPGERLPEEGVDVLVWRDGCFAIAHIICGDDWTYTGIGGDPVCWCPLPKPPTEVSCP